MLIAAAFLLNSAGNFVLGVALSAILGPAEFGRYATVALAALTLAGSTFDWLRFSTIRFSGDRRGRRASPRAWRPPISPSRWGYTPARGCSGRWGSISASGRRSFC